MRGDEATTLWRALYGSRRGLIGVHSALRPCPGSGRLERHRPTFFAYPERALPAARWCLKGSDGGLESYFCAHLLTARRRTKENAAPVMALWADVDGPIPPEAPEPSAIVETSPGHAHVFWRLRNPICPRKAEQLNRRLTAALGADRSGWDLTQLLRPPGTLNRKYEATPEVRLLELDEGTSYHPRELEMALPRVDAASAAPTLRALPKRPPSPIDLSRLSARTRALVHLGNAGAGCPYPSRSEADFAVCLAMFGAGYEEAEVWAVMTDRSNGIAEKTLGKGRHAEGYLAVTIGKARTISGVRRSD
jgi:hypothetical protein